MATSGGPVVPGVAVAAEVGRKEGENGTGRREDGDRREEGRDGRAQWQGRAEADDGEG